MRFSLSFVLPLAVSVALCLAHCGGKTTGFPEDKDAEVEPAPDGGPVSVLPSTDASPTPTPSGCPGVTMIIPGAPCATTPGTTCFAAFCGGSTVSADCTCFQGGWECNGTTCASPPPPPPKDNCVLGGSCTDGAGETCTLSGAGPCDSDVLLACTEGSDTPVFAVRSFPCAAVGGGAPTVGCGWGNGGCLENCECTNGNMICTGNCPDAGLASP